MSTSCGNEDTTNNIFLRLVFQEIDRFDQMSLKSDIWDAIEARHAAVHKA